MNLTQQHVEEAINAGLAMTDPRKDLLQVYREHTTGITILRLLLEAIGNGEVVLSSVAPPAGAQLPSDGKDDDDVDD